MEARPQTLDDVIGQQAVVRALKTVVKAYQYESQIHGQAVLPHILLTGPGGTGKTLLCEMVANQTNGCQLVTELAQNMHRPSDIHGLLLSLEPNCCLFFDEIHELNPEVAISLYRAVEEGKLFIGKKHVVQLPAFSLFGATTHEHLLAASLKQRFRLQLRMTYYSKEELQQIIQQRAGWLGWVIETQAAEMLAAMGRGTPRIAVRLLESAKRVASANQREEITLREVEQMVEIEQMDALGFDLVEQKYLSILKESTEPVRPTLISSVLGLPLQSIQSIENEFCRTGLICKTERGRILTPAGYEHLSKKETEVC